jgi:hypothetical protein
VLCFELLILLSQASPHWVLQNQIFPSDLEVRTGAHVMFFWISFCLVLVVHVAEKHVFDLVLFFLPPAAPTTSTPASSVSGFSAPPAAAVGFAKATATDLGGFGNTVTSSGTFGASSLAPKGTKHVSAGFSGVVEKDATRNGAPTGYTHVSVTALPACEAYSFEELRCHDYNVQIPNPGLSSAIVAPSFAAPVAWNVNVDQKLARSVDLSRPLASFQFSHDRYLGVEILQPNSTWPRAVFANSVTFNIGDDLDALDKDGVWYAARVVENDDEERVKVHFEGWSSRSDEWIFKKLESHRFALFGTHTDGAFCRTPQSVTLLSTIKGTIKFLV